MMTVVRFFINSCSACCTWYSLKLSATAPGPKLVPLPADKITFDEILFVKRKPYSSDHYYTDVDNGTSGDRFLPKNGIYIYNIRTKKAVFLVGDQHEHRSVYR